MKIVLGIPQLIYLALVVMDLGIALAKNGERRTGKYNIGVTLVTTVLAIILLYSGGFFN